MAYESIVCYKEYDLLVQHCNSAVYSIAKRDLLASAHIATDGHRPGWLTADLPKILKHQVKTRHEAMAIVPMHQLLFCSVTLCNARASAACV